VREKLQELGGMEGSDLMEDIVRKEARSYVEVPAGGGGGAGAGGVPGVRVGVQRLASRLYRHGSEED
jgi:hypothetical protein